MRTDYVYFKALNARINGAEKTVNFVRDEVLDGELYNLLPSTLSPVEELIKSAERALDGTMHVDITDVKTTLTVTYDYLEDKDFRFISEVFDLLKQYENYPNGLTVEYFDVKDTHAVKRITCYIDGLNYTPYVIGDGIAWRSVTITLVQI